MGTLLGHLDISGFFMAFAIWWMFRMFPMHIRNPNRYEGKLSYPLSCYPRVPIEGIFKLLCSLCAITSDLLPSGGHLRSFIKDNGQFQGTNRIQHISIYSLFFLHSILDILTFYKCGFVPPGANYMSFALSTLWCAIGFRWHAAMSHSLPLESTVHILLTYPFIVAAVTVSLECWKGGHFVLNFIRIWSFLLAGTWLCQLSFMLYDNSHLLSTKKNPNWDQQDEGNVTAAVGLFGLHASMTLAFVTMAYAMCYLVMNKCSTVKPEKHCGSDYKHLEQAECLLSDS